MDIYRAAKRIFCELRSICSSPERARKNTSTTETWFLFSGKNDEIHPALTVVNNTESREMLLPAFALL